MKHLNKVSQAAPAKAGIVASIKDAFDQWAGFAALVFTQADGRSADPYDGDFGIY